MTRLVFAVALAAGLGGCGPRVSETRMAYLPPRPDDCSIAFITATVEEMSPLGPYQVVGHVVLQDAGIQNPFSAEYAGIVRPRACAMGGELVTIGMSGTTRGFASGTSTIYVVLRRKHPVRTEPEVEPSQSI